MKTLPMITTLVLLTCTTGAAHATPPATNLNSVAMSDIDTRVDTALAKFRERVANANANLNDPAVKAAYDELIQSLRASYAAMTNTVPTAETIRSRLTAAINDIYARAQKIAINQAEFNSLQVDILNHRVLNAIRTAQAAYNAGTGTFEHLRYVQHTMTQAAEAAKAELPELAELRARMNARIDELIARARVLAADLQPLQPEVSTTNVQVFAHLLELRTLAKIQTEIDWNRARNAISDHFTLVGGTEPTAAEIQKRLLRILDGLKAKVAAGTLTRTDFDELKKEITSYARAAASPR